ncbi:hypothetical protein THAOC_04314, partial [Thalassiosira oceanica]
QAKRTKSGTRLIFATANGFHAHSGYRDRVKLISVTLHVPGRLAQRKTHKTGLRSKMSNDTGIYGGEPLKPEVAEVPDYGVINESVHAAVLAHEGLIEQPEVFSGFSGPHVNSNNIRDAEAKLRKNERSREREAREELQLEAIVAERRARKNLRSRERNLEQKAIIERIRKTPIDERTPEEAEALAVHEVRIKRKREGDKIRRLKLKQMGLGKKDKLPPGVTVAARDERKAPGASLLVPYNSISLPDEVVRNEHQLLLPPGENEYIPSVLAPSQMGVETKEEQIAPEIHQHDMLEPILNQHELGEEGQVQVDESIQQTGGNAQLQANIQLHEVDAHISAALG